MNTYQQHFADVLREIQQAESQSDVMKEKALSAKESIIQEATKKATALRAMTEKDTQQEELLVIDAYGEEQKKMKKLGLDKTEKQVAELKKIAETKIAKTSTYLYSSFEKKIIQ